MTVYEVGYESHFDPYLFFIHVNIFHRIQNCEFIPKLNGDKVFIVDFLRRLPVDVGSIAH